MRGFRTASQQNLNIELPKTTVPRKWLVFGFGAAVLVFGFLLAGIFFAPDLGVLALAGVGLGIPLLLLLWFRPEFGLLGLIFLTSSFVPATVVDIRLPIGGGLDLRDLVLIGLFGLLFIRELSNKTLLIPWWRVGGPLVLFLFFAVISTINALVFQNVETHWALSDLRILSCYVVFFIVVWSIKRAGQLQVLLVGLFIIADLTTAIVILQQFAGADNPLLEAMLTTRDWRVYQGTGGIRVIPAGQILMHFMWFIALGLLIFSGQNPRKQALLVFQILFLGVGHILSYMRAQWAAMFLGFGLVCLVIVPRYRYQLPKYFILGLSIILVMAVLWGTIGLSNLYQIPFVSGVADRFVSMISLGDTLETNSLEWREFENGKALEAIRKRPLLGVGLGARYRDLTIFQGEALGRWTKDSIAAGEVSRFTRYVHNSYLSIAVKMGIPALAVILWFFIALIVNGWKIYQRLFNIENRGIVLGILASFAGLLAWSFFHAHLIKAESTPVIALMAGLVAVIDSLHKRDGISHQNP